MRYFKIAIAILKRPALRGGGNAACAAVHTARANHTIVCNSGQYIKNAAHYTT